MKRIRKWIKEHVRPHIAYQAIKGKEIDFKEDSPKQIISKIKDQVEVGIKFNFKF